MTDSLDAPTPLPSIQSLHLDLPPSCLEFCPDHPSYFLVGTYNLQNNDGVQDVVEDATAGGDQDDQDNGRQPSSAKLQSRNGTIMVFSLIDSNILHVQTEQQPSAILDLRFNPNHGSRDICAAVSSTSTLALFQLDPKHKPPLKHLRTMDMAAMSRGEVEPAPGTEVLFLSFSWHPSRADMIAVSTSTGHIYLITLRDVNGSWELHPEPVITHTLEAWCVVITPCLDPAVPYYQDSFLLLSGGDDSMLRCQTVTCKDEPGPSSTQHTTDVSLPPSKLRGHDAGVTAILPLPLKTPGQRLVVTGSYDDHIRLFSLTSANAYSPYRAQNLAESNLGGGVWRLTLIDLDETGPEGCRWRARVLVSCMHAGARVVELEETTEGRCQFRTVARFEEHQSMNYGSDFQPGSVEKRELSVVSTSFYDKLMCLWELDL